MDGMGHFSEGQLRLLFLVHSYLLRPVQPGQPQAIDAEVADAAGALAATLETASRGLVCEHKAATPGGRRMATELLGVLQEVGKGGGSRFEREAAQVLRAIERGARPDEGRGASPRAYLELVARVLGDQVPPAESASRIVLP
jgi:hypothetical protein